MTLNLFIILCNEHNLLPNQVLLDLPDVNKQIIAEKKIKIVVDGINSSGGVFVPFLLQKLGVEVSFKKY